MGRLEMAVCHTATTYHWMLGLRKPEDATRRAHWRTVQRESGFFGIQVERRSIQALEIREVDPQGTKGGTANVHILPPPWLCAICSSNISVWR